MITTTNILAETMCADSLDGIVTTQIHPTCRRSLDPSVDESPRIDPFRRLAAPRKEDVDPDDDMNDEDWDEDEDEEDDEWDEDEEDWDDDEDEWDEDEEDDDLDEDEEDWDEDEDEDE
ncbi:MAG: hypothetical protein RDU20_06670 [Desulfomonilaceae bacterium]|nr:hypothetical protein [Desulfomonilaceae bacterium]